MKLKPLSAVIALVLSGCGSQNSAGPQGTTLSHTIPLGDGVMIACVDSNRNWQCDDGDVSRLVEATGATGLSPSAEQYTLIETRNATNRRTTLLVSTQGSANVDGASTLSTSLQLQQVKTSQIDAALALATPAEFEAGITNTLAHYPTALAGLSAYSLAVEKQATATPVLTDFVAGNAEAQALTQWYSEESPTSRRQLSAQGSRVLNNSESNRLYLFDANAATLATHEIDLIPNNSPLMANNPKWARPLWRSLAAAVNVFIDTASAATGFSGTPSTGSPVTLPPGQGIAGVQLVNQGRQALVLLNMLDGRFSGESCLDAEDGTEGLFKVELSGDRSYRLLDETTACIHSGFSLIASDETGKHIAAWDATGQKLWLLDGESMQALSAITLGLDSDTQPQTLAMSAGGRYLAAVGYGRAVLVDLHKGKVITQLTGSISAGVWGNVAAASFAAGTRRLLIASGQQVHSLALDNSLQLIEHTQSTVTDSTETLRALSVSMDGDSYVAVTDTAAYWSSIASTTKALSSEALTRVPLPLGLAVQQAVVTDESLVVMARGLQDQEFRMLRLPLTLTPKHFVAR